MLDLVFIIESYFLSSNRAICCVAAQIIFVVYVYSLLGTAMSLVQAKC